MAAQLDHERENREDFIHALAQTVDEAELSVSTFWESQRIRDFLQRVCDVTVTPVLSLCSSKQNAQIRLEFIVKLLTSALCFPVLGTFMGMGSRTGHLDEIKLCIKEALIFFYDAELALYFEDSDHSLDANRVSLLLSLLQVRKSSIIPFEITLEENFALFMQCLISHLLCVRALSDDIEAAITTNLHALKEDILRSNATAPVRAPEDPIINAASHLFEWLREHQKELKRSCRNAEIIKSVNSSVRAWLRDEEYQSPLDIVKVFQRKYASHLTDLRIPLQNYTSRDRTQAVKDLEREVTKLNEQIYIGGDVVQAIFAEIAKVVTFHFELPEGVPSVGRSRSTSLSGRRDSGDSVLGHDTFDLLVSHVLVAASRTIVSGDAFFIVQDLYGGDGLVLRPGGPAIKSKTPGSTISISVTADEILVTVQETFELVNETDIDRMDKETSSALVYFWCATRTKILLSESATEHAMQNSTISISEADKLTNESLQASLPRWSSAGYNLHRLLLSDPDSVCRKSVSIEPFIS